MVDIGISILFNDAVRERAREQYRIRDKEIYYKPIGREVELFETAFQKKQSVAFLGPTGCGKSRFFEYMAAKHKRPCIIVPGDETVDAGMVVGTPYVVGNESVFIPGPLYVGCEIGAFVMLEEVLEMRKDVLPFLHPLADKRRRLIVNDINRVVEPEKEFMLAVSFNPGAAYQSAHNTFPKPSFIQRFTVIDFSYIRGLAGIEILMKESGIDEKIATSLDRLAVEIDKLHQNNQFPQMRESVGYHALVKAAEQIVAGTAKLDACHACISSVLSHDQAVVRATDDIARKILGA